jgi:hypothetical protein
MYDLQCMINNIARYQGKTFSDNRTPDLNLKKAVLRSSQLGPISLGAQPGWTEAITAGLNLECDIMSQLQVI